MHDPDYEPPEEPKSREPILTFDVWQGLVTLLMVGGGLFTLVKFVTAAIAYLRHGFFPVETLAHNGVLPFNTGWIGIDRIANYFVTDIWVGFYGLAPTGIFLIVVFLLSGLD